MKKMPGINRAMHFGVYCLVLIVLFSSSSSAMETKNGIDYTPLHTTNSINFMAEQNQFRRDSANSRSMIVIPGDDDHVWSSAPTESTYAPTPSGTTSLSSTCLDNCPGFNRTTWNLDNWCKFYWDAECYLPDVNFLQISPAGKKEVSDYACVPTCLQSSTCGAAYCREFSHLSSSCRTGYAHLLFNSSLQDTTHEKCMDSFLRSVYAGKGWSYNNGANLTFYIWRAAFTIVPVTYTHFLSDPRNELAVRSAMAHVLSGVSLRDVSIKAVEDLALKSPTMHPTYITPFPTKAPTPAPTFNPTHTPTLKPTPHVSTHCLVPERNHWCNNNQGENIYLGLAVDPEHCQSLCNAYIGADFQLGCCQWYAGNSESLYQYSSCSLQPNGYDTIWPDGNTFWSASCNTVSAFPSPAPTMVPSLASGATATPTPSPTPATPLPTRTPTLHPTPVPSVQPTEFFSPFPTRAPTIAAIGIRVTVEIKTSTETLGFPMHTRAEAYNKLKSELQHSFVTRGFLDSLILAGKSYNASSLLTIAGAHDLQSSYPGVDSAAFPTAAPTPDNSTPAPTPTAFFDGDSSIASGAKSDNTGAIAGGTAAAVVGVGVAGTAVYQYAGANVLKVAAEPVQAIELLVV